MSDKTMFVGIFDRCENYPSDLNSILNKSYLICNDNKYCFNNNAKCRNLANLTLNPRPRSQFLCNSNNNPHNCDYSPIAKGLIAGTIIAACTLAVITICLLCVGWIFILITLILFGSTMRYDLYQYRYDLDLRLLNCSSPEDLKNNVTKEVDNNYDIRLDWSSALEIVALILSSFTLVTQIIYLISTYRNRIG
ncbi:unnamed protein product [Rotaria sp. Silwood2]|nr:unnamed protein product [Rotaria sp. Silwood2]CAF4104424.1 unnamed protein product [Rotaria sp. Silwood2]